MRILKKIESINVNEALESFGKMNESGQRIVAFIVFTLSMSAVAYAFFSGGTSSAKIEPVDIQDQIS